MVEDAPQSDPLRQAVLAMLAAGPLPLAEIVRRLDQDRLLDDLRGDGVADDELERAVRHEVIVTDEIWPTAGDVLVLADQLTDGMVLTHRLTADEIDAGEVFVTPDLVVLDWNADDGLDLAGGGRLQHILGDRVPGEDTSVLAGPPDWLDGYEAGDMLAFTRHGQTVTVGAAASLDDDGREVDLLRGTIDGRIRPGGGEESVPLALDALAADPTAFRHPVRPLGELLEAAGLERRGFSFGRAGEAWTTFAERAAEHEHDDLVQSWRFNGCCEAAFDLVHDAFDAFVDGEDIDIRHTAEALAHGSVAPALADHLLDTEAEGYDELARFAATLVTTPRSKHSAAGHLLVALEAERRGDASTAEAALRNALRADPGYGLAAVELAPYELDRGHVDRAITLLHHPDLGFADPTLPFLTSLHEKVTGRFRDVGRNAQCPCGSGRKFKVCCQRDPKVPLSARTALVTHRLALFAGRPHRRPHLVGVASSACDPDDPDLIDTLADMIRNPIISDFVIFDGGVVEEYLEERGHLLAEDERFFIEQLVDEPRRLWEVTAVERGTSMTLRDTKTGESVVVTEHLGSLDRSVGELMLGRAARVGEQHQLVGLPIEIPLRLRDSALRLVDSRPDADALAMWYGQAIAPPRLENREGEVLELCRVEMATETAIDDVRAALSRVLDEGEDDSWTESWSLPNAEQVLRGTVSVEGGNIVIDTNSVERLERLIETVTSAVPDATIVLDERTDPRQAMRKARLGLDADELDLDDDLLDDDLDLDDRVDGTEVPPEELEMILEDFIRRKEAEWVEESIPALGGLTPRQALDDPTRREDLFELLREMDRLQPPQPGGGRGFDAARIRALLGIDSAA